MSNHPRRRHQQPFQIYLHSPTPSFFSKGQVINNVGGGGGATKLEREASAVLPLEKGGGGGVLAMLKVGHNKFWGSFNRRA